MSKTTDNGLKRAEKTRSNRLNLSDSSITSIDADLIEDTIDPDYNGWLNELESWNT
jgi:hypothetical protein